MKKTLIAFLAFLLTALAGFGQESNTYTPVRELVEQQGARTVRIRAAFSGVHDLSRLVFLVRDGDYIIPIRLLKKDLGAEKRFLDLHLQEGDMVAVEGARKTLNPICACCRCARTRRAASVVPGRARR